MVSQNLKKSVLISTIGHLTLFSIFGFSFGNKIPQTNFPSVRFWGQIMPLLNTNYHKCKRKHEFPRIKIELTRIIRENSCFFQPDYLKPASSLPFNTQKAIFIKEVERPAVQRKEPALIFHPLLPYSFMLYFKDRQIAHVELMFNITSGGHTPVILKRKISSGNLEVDLLSLRYVGRYLSIQKVRFASDSWQTVKIDLTE